MDKPQHEADLQPLCEADEISPGESLTVDLADRTIVLFQIDNAYYALDNECPHQGGPIGKGKIEDECVYCPWHGWQFNVEDGSHMQGIADATSYNVVAENGKIYLRL